MSEEIGFWKKFYNYVKTRLNSNVETVAKSTGGVLTVWGVSLISGAIGAFTGNPEALNIAIIAGLGATSSYFAVLMRTIFGKPSNNNGNGT